MNLTEFVKLDSHKVRNSEDLMGFYLQEFPKVFGRLPNCVGCTFKSDWKKFKQRVLTGNITNTKLKVMATEKKSFELQPRHANTIFTYTENKRPVRSYGFNMTEEFAKNLLSKGTKAQIEERKKAFKKLPGEVKEEPKKIKVGEDEIELSKATGAQMDQYAEDNEVDFGEATKVDEKRAVIEKSL